MFSIAWIMPILLVAALLASCAATCDVLFRIWNTACREGRQHHGCVPDASAGEFSLAFAFDNVCNNVCTPSEDEARDPRARLRQQGFCEVYNFLEGAAPLARSPARRHLTRRNHVVLGREPPHGHGHVLVNFAVTI